MLQGGTGAIKAAGFIEIIRVIIAILSYLKEFEKSFLVGRSLSVAGAIVEDNGDNGIDDVGNPHRHQW